MIMIIKLAKNLKMKPMKNKIKKNCWKKYKKKKILVNKNKIKKNWTENKTKEKKRIFFIYYYILFRNQILFYF